ncbi:L,D-transpeptidase [Umezawaea tangerina]|uniref:L,D-transpeptidase-like protein n=1 Tax=Umezawaea tangerina TaxID=84725 RepID=A0A2T0TM89_9PSEU|nr:L,D-transpeptidase [Umezawaea tangerina]PRY46731.1 L,D-transpeptidase-like protein [Umezawaea tangerina]
MRVLVLVATALLATACAQGGTTEAAAPPALSTSAGPSSSAQPSSSAAPASSSASSSSEAPAPAPEPAPAPSTSSEAPPPPQPAPPPPPVTVAGTPCDITNGACVELSSQQTWLISNGAVTYGPVPITSGRPGYETPTGYFPVLHKVLHEISRPYNNAPMPYSVYFTNYGIAFHEGSLEVPSHGCVHLSQEAAATYFDFLQSGQQVQVTP